MEEPKRKNASAQEMKGKRMTIQLGGGGGGGALGGVLFLGGALAAATLVSAFAIRRRSRGRSTDKKKYMKLQEEKDGDKDEVVSKGLSSLLPDSPPQPLSDDAADQMESMSSSSISTETLILDGKPKPEMNGGKVRLNTSKEEFSSPMFNSPPVQKPELEDIEVRKEEDEANDAATDLPVVIEDNPQIMQRTTEEAAGEEDDDDAIATQLNEEEQEIPSGRDQETVSSDNLLANPESSTSALENNGVNQQDFSLMPDFDSRPILKPENTNQNYSVEVEDEEEEEVKCDAVEAAPGGDYQIAEEEDNPEIMQLNIDEETERVVLEMQLDEDQEDTFMAGDQDIIPETSASESRGVNKQDFMMLPSFESSQLILEPGEKVDENEEIKVEAGQLGAKDEVNIQMQLNEADQITGERGEKAHEKTAHADHIPEDDQQIQVQEEILLNGNHCVVLDNPSLSEPENVKKDGSTETLSLSIEAGNRVEVIAIQDNPTIQLIEKELNEVHDDQSEEQNVAQDVAITEIIEEDTVAADDNQTMQLTEDGEESEEDEEDIAEKVDESSNGTGDSSMESNAEAIWPAEFMTELSVELEEPKISSVKLDEKTDDKMGKKDEGDHHKSVENGQVNGDDGKIPMSFSQRYMMELAKEKSQSTNSWKLRTLIWSLLVPLWCLCCRQLGLPFVKLCLIIVLSVVLFKFQEVF